MKEILQNPSVENIETLTKSVFICMEKTLELDVALRMTKYKLLRTIFLHLVEDSRLDEEVLEQ